jgi:hypothetical protein
MVHAKVMHKIGLVCAIPVYNKKTSLFVSEGFLFHLIL